MKTSCWIFLLSLFYSFPGLGQCVNSPLLDAGPDVVICTGGSVQLSASPGWPSYSWSPAAGMTNPDTIDQIVSPGLTTTYTVTGTIFGPNLVVNGDFSQGNTGFTNGYIYTSTYSPCNYYVSNDYFTLGDPTFADHTATSDNMSMAIDGCSGGEVLWEQTVSVLPNTNYAFSFWATRAGQIQPIFVTTVTGNASSSQVINTATGLPGASTWEWDEYGGSLNSGSNTSITITLTNLETNGFGNDFAMDDFSLRTECTESAQVTVYVSGVPTDLGPDLILCDATSQLLHAGAGSASYLWNDGSTGNTLFVTSSGTYWVATLDSCGGAHSDTVQITLVAPLVLDLGGDLSICAGDTTHFATVPGMFSSYLWTGLGLSCNTCPNPDVFPAASTEFSLVATTPEGCSVTDSVFVSIVPLPQIDLGNDVFTCSGDPLVLSNAFSLPNYNWSPAVAVSCVNCPNPSVSPIVSTTYFLTSANALGCTASDSVRMNISPVPVLELGNDVTVCKGESTQFNFTPDAAFTSFEWTPVSDMSCSNCIHPEVSPSHTTLYYLEATTTAGCTAIDSITVFVRDDVPQNVTILVTDASCESSGTVAIEAIGNGTGELQYNFNQQGFSTNPLYQNVVPGNYLVSVRVGDNGCPFHTAAVVGGEPNIVFIPNAFTPDGNAINNTWRIRGTCVFEVRCRIFNRWGEEIEVLTDLSDEWDGTSHGIMVPDGVYTYQVEVTYISQFKEVLTGFITVIR